MPHYDAVIFDLDGTLVDSSDGIACAAEEALRILGYPEISRNEIVSFIGPPIGDPIIDRLGLGNRELNEFNTVFRDAYKNKYLMNASLYPGISELLSDVGKVSFVGIATNKREDYAKILLDRIGISGFCHDIRAMDFEGKLNKDKLVENCVRSSKISDMDRIVMVGDTKMDADAAERCGIDFIGVTFGFGFKKEEDITYGKSADSVDALRALLLPCV